MLPTRRLSDWTQPFRGSTSRFSQLLDQVQSAGREYRIYGYKGKQVRDNIHAEDVARFMYEFYKAPRVAEVYNLGGGKGNSCSILEAVSMIEGVTGREMKSQYIDENRVGDHICYYSDLRKMKSHYPNWAVRKDLRQIVGEIASAWMERS